MGQHLSFSCFCRLEGKKSRPPILLLICPHQISRKRQANWRAQLLVVPRIHLWIFCLAQRAVRNRTQNCPTRSGGAPNIQDPQGPNEPICKKQLPEDTPLQRHRGCRKSTERSNLVFKDAYNLLHFLLALPTKLKTRKEP